MQCHTIVGSVKKRKRAWSSRKEAKIGLRNAAKHYGFNPDDYEVYRCKECRKYHYGSKLKPAPTQSAPQSGVGVAYA